MLPHVNIYVKMWNEWCSVKIISKISISFLCKQDQRSCEIFLTGWEVSKNQEFYDRDVMDNKSTKYKELLVMLIYSTYMLFDFLIKSKIPSRLKWIWVHVLMRDKNLHSLVEKTSFKCWQLPLSSSTSNYYVF